MEKKKKKNDNRKIYFHFQTIRWLKSGDRREEAERKEGSRESVNSHTKEVKTHILKKKKVEAVDSFCVFLKPWNNLKYEKLRLIESIILIGPNFLSFFVFNPASLIIIP